MQATHDPQKDKAALRAPLSQSTRETNLQAERTRRALEARRMGAELRRGKMKSFRPVVGSI